jgi:hypothetical protein
MRSLRSLITSAALVATLPSLAAAQRGREFDNSWFWGLKAGGFTFSDSTGRTRTAGSVGLEWLITRTHGGLYVAGSESFLNAGTRLPLDPATADTVNRGAHLKNLRRLDMAVVGFPGDHLRWHPYFGVGFVLSQIAAATPVGPFARQDQVAFDSATVQQTRTGFSPLLLAGAQYRFRPASVFAQLELSPAQKNFLLYNGNTFYYSYEIGVRYNFGTSISDQ